MTMWVSLEAINAEVEYRRERDLRRAALARIARKRRAGRIERRRAERNGTSGARTPEGTGGRAAPPSEATLPEQRTSGSSPVTKQPA